MNINYEYYRIFYYVAKLKSFTQAAACLMRLITGERGSRSYTYSCGEEYGYFYDPFLKKWMAFDNRHNTCLVEQCNTSKEAENFLYDDTGLFAA